MAIILPNGPPRCFADGVIACRGIMLGGGRMVTFDRQAAALWKPDGDEVLLLAAG